MKRLFRTIDKFLIEEMHHWAIPCLRIALGVVFLWFGALKVIGITPVTELVAATYPFFPLTQFVVVLGVWEVVIGVGLLFKVLLRGTLALLWLQMAGTLFAAALHPALFFVGGNLFLLTMEGEFVVKNLVLIAASLVVGGYSVPRRR